MAKKDKQLKTIAGVKLPKGLRKSRLRRAGSSLAALLESPTAREVLAGVLTAAAGALVSSKPVRQGVAETGSSMAQAGKEAAQDAAGSTKDLALAAADAVVGAARQILPSSLAGDERGTGGGHGGKDERSDKGGFTVAGADDKRSKGRDKRNAH